MGTYQLTHFKMSRAIDLWGRLHSKIHLMQTRQMTEEEAHYFLEKEAMDRSLSKKEVAEEVLGSA